MTGASDKSDRATHEPSPTVSAVPVGIPSAADLERIFRPIVEGQARSFVNDHPQILDSVDWYKPRRDRRTTLVNSIAKRIIQDLLCVETRVRLGRACSGFNSGAAREARLSSPSGGRGVVCTSDAAGDGVAFKLPRPRVAQAIEAGTAETERLGAKHESAVAESHAPCTDAP